MSAETRRQEIAIPYPRGIAKYFYKLPILLYRLGLGFVAGRLFLVLTTWGRKSGQPRRTAVEFHTWKGRKYIVSGWGEKAHWYRNIQANPHVTIQTAAGAESVVARRVTDDDDLREAFELIEHNPTMRAWVAALGGEVSADAFVREKNRFFLITFDPTTERTPPPLTLDLRWVWLPLGGITLLVMWQMRPRRRHKLS